MKVLDIIAMILMILGGLNWGIIGVADVNVVESIFVSGTVLTHIIYILVGVSALYYIFQWKAIIARFRK